MSEKIKSIVSTELSKNGKAIVFRFDNGKSYMIPVSSLKDITEDARLVMDMMESRRKMKCKEIERRTLEIWKEKDRFLRTVEKMKEKAKKLVENYQKLRFEFKQLADEAHKIKAEISTINKLNQGLPNVPYPKEIHYTRRPYRLKSYC